MPSEEQMLQGIYIYFFCSFRSNNIALHAALGKIPYKFNKVLDYYRHTSDKLLSNTANRSMDETMEYNFLQNLFLKKIEYQLKLFIQ